MIYLLTIITLLLAGCGYQDGNVGTDTTSSLSLNVKILGQDTNKTSYNTLDKFTVSVSAEDIEEEIIAEFDGESEEGLLSDIPAGIDRTVRVEAVNLQEKVIYQGRKEGVEIVGGEINSVDVELEQVPIFANIKDDASILQSRLKFRLYSSPEDLLVVEKSGQDSISTVFDVSSNAGEFATDITTGLADIVPLETATGRQTFSVRSLKTGLSSSVEINILDADVIGAPLFSGGGPFLSEACRVGSVVGGVYTQVNNSIPVLQVISEVK